MVDTLAAGNARSTETASEQRVLRVSMLVGVALCILGIGWGIVGGSQMILFDGVYALVGISLTWISLWASRIVEAGPTARYPWGREALTPMVIAFQGIPLFATCVYAVVDAVATIRDGGSEVTGASGVGYGLISLAAAVVAYLWIRRHAAHSDLMSAEATQWMAGAALSVGMVVGFGAVIALNGTAWAGAGRYIDPAMVIAACVVLVPAPFGMVRSTLVELLEGAPGEQVQQPVRSAVDDVKRQFGLGDHHLRLAKAGRKLYVEVDFVVPEDYVVRDEDTVRHNLLARLEQLPHDVWLSVEFTADPTWGD